jgi:hypothetical protein
MPPQSDKPLRYVSLGGDCQPAHQIRRHAGQPDLMDVFDWLESSIDSVSHLIGTGFADFFQPENLTFEPFGEDLHVTDTKNSVASFHHFRSQDPEHVEQTCLMFRMLGRRFMELLKSDAPVIFVRRWIPLDGPDGASKTKRLYDKLAVRKPNIVMLHMQENDPLPPTTEGGFISVFNPSTAHSPRWEGYNAIYQRNLIRAARLHGARHATETTRATA